MRIALRTSGGRGEYEIAGSHDNVKTSDVIGYSIIIEILPGYTVETNNAVRHIQGKPRIRLESNVHARHIYLILADLLLLPKPKREIGTTPGGNLQLVDNNYSITSIPFEIIKMDENQLYVSITNVLLSNSDEKTARLNVIERMRILLDVWAAAENRTDDISLLIIKHKNAFYTGVDEKIAVAADDIRKKLNDSQDPLKLLSGLVNVTDPSTYWMGLHTTEAESLDEFLADDNPANIKESMHTFINQWRIQACRGPAAVQFSAKVKSLYNNTCLFSGYFLPKIELTGSAGVESAHILPWAQYDLNSEDNGICLNKLCHWAFDAGILRLNFSGAENGYILSIPEPYLSAERNARIDLTPFKKLLGPLPISRLPRDARKWPNPKYLEEYNKSLDAGM